MHGINFLSANSIARGLSAEQNLTSAAGNYEVQLFSDEMHSEAWKSAGQPIPLVGWIFILLSYGIRKLNQCINSHANEKMQEFAELSEPILQALHNRGVQTAITIPLNDHKALHFEELNRHVVVTICSGNTTLSRGVIRNQDLNAVALKFARDVLKTENVDSYSAQAKLAAKKICAADDYRQIDETPIVQDGLADDNSLVVNHAFIANRVRFAAQVAVAGAEPSDAVTLVPLRAADLGKTGKIFEAPRFDPESRLRHFLQEQGFGSDWTEIEAEALAIQQQEKRFLNWNPEKISFYEWCLMDVREQQDWHDLIKLPYLTAYPDTEEMQAIPGRMPGNLNHENMTKVNAINDAARELKAKGLLKNWNPGPAKFLGWYLPEMHDLNSMRSCFPLSGQDQAMRLLAQAHKSENVIEKLKTFTAAAELAKADQRSAFAVRPSANAQPRNEIEFTFKGHVLFAAVVDEDEDFSALL